MINEVALQALMDQEEGLIQRAVAQCMKAYNDKPTADNLKNWTAAKQGLEAFTKNKYAQANPQALQFKNIPQVLDYLKAAGWKICLTKLYEDKNLINKQKDGSMLRADVDRYAETLLSKLDGSDIGDLDVSEKLKWETEIAKQKAMQLTRRNEVEAGIYILKSEVEQQLAGRAAYLKSNLGMDFIHSRAAQLIRVCDGNQQRAPELIDYWLEQIEQVFDYYAQPIQFSVAYAAIVQETE